VHLAYFCKWLEAYDDSVRLLLGFLWPATYGNVTGTVA